MHEDGTKRPPTSLSRSRGKVEVDLVQLASATIAAKTARRGCFAWTLPMTIPGGKCNREHLVLGDGNSCSLPRPIAPPFHCPGKTRLALGICEREFLPCRRCIHAEGCVHHHRSLVAGVVGLLGGKIVRPCSFQGRVGRDRPSWSCPRSDGEAGTTHQVTWRCFLGWKRKRRC